MSETKEKKGKSLYDQQQALVQKRLPRVLAVIVMQFANPCAHAYHQWATSLFVRFRLQIGGWSGRKQPWLLITRELVPTGVERAKAYHRESGKVRWLLLERSESDVDRSDDDDWEYRDYLRKKKRAQLKAIGARTCA